MKKTAFIGHRIIPTNVVQRKLIEAIENQIKNGCNIFTMGSHGAFDNLALAVCLKLKNTYPHIEIEIVITSLTKISNNTIEPYYRDSDVHLVMYEIEDLYFKQQIIMSNRQMLDTCDTLICYVDETTNKSGAKTAMNYAKKQGLKIINLFDSRDINNMTKN